MSSHNHGHISKVTAAGLLVTLGIIYGDIGTSPLYVMSAIIGTKTIEASVVIGAMSLVFGLSHYKQLLSMWFLL
jgi:KUP system potassium uptake protein